MKIKVTMKDPDVLDDAIVDAIHAQVEREFQDKDERDAVYEVRCDKARKAASKFFEYGEYLRVELDTEAGTCVVLPVKP